MNDQQVLEKDYEEMDLYIQQRGNSATINMIIYDIWGFFVAKICETRKWNIQTPLASPGIQDLRSGRRYVLQNISVLIISGL